MERIKGIVGWVVLALLVGAGVNVGSKAVDHFWPGSPITIKYEGGACE